MTHPDAKLAAAVLMAAAERLRSRGRRQRAFADYFNKVAAEADRQAAAIKADFGVPDPDADKKRRAAGPL